MHERSRRRERHTTGGHATKCMDSIKLDDDGRDDRMKIHMEVLAGEREKKKERERKREEEWGVKGPPPVHGWGTLPRPHIDRPLRAHKQPRVHRL